MNRLVKMNNGIFNTYFLENVETRMGKVVGKRLSKEEDVELINIFYQHNKDLPEEYTRNAETWCLSDSCALESALFPKAIIAC